MFLMQLKNQEKFEFLRLARYLAYIDGEFKVDEAKMIKDYCDEMGINDIQFDCSNYNLDEALKSFQSKKSQKIILLELLTLVHADDCFDISEHEIIHKIATTFDLDTNSITFYSQWGKALSALKTQGEIFIED